MLDAFRSSAVTLRRRRLSRRLGRWGRRYRRWAGAALVGVGGWLALTLMTSPGPPTVTVAIAARDLAPGSLLQQQDVGQAHLPAALVPPTALSPDAALGATLGTVRGKGEMLTSTALVGSDLLLGAAGDHMAVPVPLSAGTGAVLVAGDRIDVLAAVPTVDGSRVSVAARDVAVLRVSGPGAQGPDWLESAAPPATASAAAFEGGASSIVVAATPTQARALVAGAADGVLWPAVRPRR